MDKELAAVALVDDDARSSSLSDSDSESSTSISDSTSDSDSEEEIELGYLQSLLDTARQKAREEAQRIKMLREENAFGETDVIKVGNGEDEKEDECVFAVVVGVGT